MGIARHASLDVLEIRVVALQLGDVDIEAVSEGQERPTLGRTVYDGVDNLDAHLGGPSGGVGLVVNVKVRCCLVAG